MIHRYSLDTLNRWQRGEFKVQLDAPGREKPIGYCDGTAEDEAEIRAMAEDEGVDDLPIRKKFLKTGREIWTVGHPPADVDSED